MQADVIAKPAGQPVGRLEKRPADARRYVIDLAPLLRLHELATRVHQVRAGDCLQVGEARTRQGRFAEVELAGGDVPTGRPSVDHALEVTVGTTMGTVVAVVDVRVHR